MPDVPADIQAALEAGELSEAQLRELIRLEAEALGMTFEEAVAKARAGTLPRTLIASDLEMLVELLPQPKAA